MRWNRLLPFCPEDGGSMSETIYQTARRHTPEDSSLHTCIYRPGNLKSNQYSI
jgi:hypothetical protein